MSYAITVRSKSLLKFFKNFIMSGSSMKLSDTATVSSISSVTSVEHYCYLSKAQDFIPKLNSNFHKGQCGKIGVIGGCFEYTGAPYFAAITSLKTGADVVHVFCTIESGPVIKSYSPELIVHPFLERSDVVKRIEPWLEKMHALVIGPGMGRDAGIMKNVEKIITHCNSMESPLPLIIDADGLFLITEKLDLVKNYTGPVILTPNFSEFTRLSIKLDKTDPLEIASYLNAIILQKGSRDVIANGIVYQKFQLSHNELRIFCDFPGSSRRCGGQGDILSGCIATFVAWLQIYLSHKNYVKHCQDEDDLEEQKNCFREILMKYSCAVYSACVITKTCSRLAYEEKGRSMTASDMIPYIHKAFVLHFGV